MCGLAQLTGGCDTIAALILPFPAVLGIRSTACLLKVDGIFSSPRRGAEQPPLGGGKILPVHPGSGSSVGERSNAHELARFAHAVDMHQLTKS
jgi:hypothetical protein